MTTTGRKSTPNDTRRSLAPAARQAAARMVVAANTANGKETDRRIVAIADEGSAEASSGA